MKKILFVASEAVPFIKTGGLADVVGALPKCFDKNEYDVRVIIPKYMCMKEEYKNQIYPLTLRRNSLIFQKQLYPFFRLLTSDRT